MATTIPQRELDNRAGEILDRVSEDGEEFLVTKRGVPVARIVPVVLNPLELVEQLAGAGLMDPDDSSVGVDEWLDRLRPIEAEGSSDEWIRRERSRG